MKNITLVLFIFASSICLGQRIGMIGSVSGSKRVAASSNIQHVTITVNPAQYLGASTSVTANTNGATVTNWKWRVIHRIVHQGGRPDTIVKATSIVPNPIFLAFDSTGFYDIQLIARSSVDKYVCYETRKFFVFKPKVPEASADYVVDVSAGSYYRSFLGIDMSDKVIFMKGTNSHAEVQFRDLHGTKDHPVYIYKADDNVQVSFEWSGGDGKPWWFSQYDTSVAEGARYIVVNGFNADGTQGIKVSGGSSGTTTTIRVEGKLTDVGFYGVEVYANPLTIDGAAFAIVPTVSWKCRKQNWETNNIHVWMCKGYAGEEFTYFGESNQSTGYTGNNGFQPPSGWGAVCARNISYGSGRDGGQIGCIGGEIHNNIIRNFGQQGDPFGQEAGFVFNDGSWGHFFENDIQGGDEFLSIKSGEYNYAPLSGQSSPQPILIESNIFSSGTYSEVGDNEPFAIYMQNNPNSGPGNWTVTVRNNIIDCDNKAMESLLAIGGFTSYNFGFYNNIINKTGTAGDSEALNFTGNGKATLQGGTKTENNQVLNRGVSDLSGYYFANYSAGDFSITNLSSTAYTGSPTTGSASFDFLGFPIPIPGVGYFFGPYSSYNLRTIEP